MPIDYTGTSAGLFVRLGKLVNLGAEHRTAQGTVVTHIEETIGKYTATSVDRREYLGTLAGDKNMVADEAGRSLQGAVQEAMAATIIEQVASEAAVRLESKTLPVAMRILATDMIATTNAIGATTISIGSQATTAAETNTAAQGAFLMSSAPRYSYGGSKTASKPSATDSILAETVVARCTKDARDGSLIRGNERFQVAGADPVDRLDRRWPQGSGAVLAINSTCGAIEGSAAPGQNMLSNGGFERVNGTPYPLDWTALVGVEGTDIISETKPYRGTYGLKFVGKAAMLHAVYQVMGQGPRPSVKSNTVYFFSARIRSNSGTISAGTMSLELRDGTNTQISGCSVSRNFNAGGGGTNLGTGYELIQGSFTTPLAMPTEVRATITFSVALAAGAELIIDEIVLAEGAYLYRGGPCCAIVAGSSDHELDDRMSRTITKTANQWQQELDRYLNLAALDVQLPTASGTSVTISTSLIA